MTQSHSVDPVIDPRGPRFAAWVTTAVLVIVLVTASTLLLAAQAIVFAVGAFAGLQLHPYGLIYRTFVAPGLAHPLSGGPPYQSDSPKASASPLPSSAPTDTPPDSPRWPSPLPPLRSARPSSTPHLACAWAARSTSGYRFSCAADEHPVALGNMAEAGQIRRPEHSANRGTTATSVSSSP